MCEQDIGRAVRAIKPPEDMEDRIIRAMRAPQKRPRLRMGFAIAFACLLLALPAMAAVDSLYEQLYRVAPGIAQYFRPVRMADEDKGIRMEVASQLVEGDTARVLLSLTDTTGHRIDDTTDLYDSYDIRTPHGMEGHCERAGYDEKTGTASFLVTLKRVDGKAIAGDKITFSVGCFLSGKHAYEDIAIPVNLSMEAREKPARTVGLSGGSMLAFGYEAKVLKEEAPYDVFPVKGIELTGLGLVDGRLHVAVRIEDRLKNDNHGFFYLKDARGKVIRAGQNCYYYETQSGRRVDYIEDIFDVPVEILKGCTLYGSFYTADQCTEGNWQVTFPLNKAR